MPCLLLPCRPDLFFARHIDAPSRVVEGPWRSTSQCKKTGNRPF